MKPYMFAGRDNRKSEPKRYGIKTSNGFEILSDDGELKGVAVKETILGGTFQDSFISLTYFVKEEGGWSEASEKPSFLSEGEFLKALAKMEGFSLAYRDLTT